MNQYIKKESNGDFSLSINEGNYPTIYVKTCCGGDKIEFAYISTGDGQTYTYTSGIIPEFKKFDGWTK